MKNTPLTSDASLLSKTLFRNVLQAFIRLLSGQEVGGMSTRYMRNADDKQSVYKKVFSGQSQTHRAGNSTGGKATTHKCGGHNSASFKMNC